MKKAWIMLVITIIVSVLFVSCGKTPDVSKMDESEYESYAQESMKAEQESTSKREENIEKAIAKTEKEIGKSQKDKKLVVKIDYGNHTDYVSMIFGDNGYAEKKYTYSYFESESDYEYYLDVNLPDSKKIIDSDDELRCIVYENKLNIQLGYDHFYEQYSGEDNYTIIE